MLLEKNRACTCITTAVIPSDSQHCYLLSTLGEINKDRQLALSLVTLPLTSTQEDQKKEGF